MINLTLLSKTILVNGFMVTMVTSLDREQYRSADWKREIQPNNNKEKLIFTISVFLDLPILYI